MTPEQIALLLTQVPLIGVFIAFELIVRKSDREEREKRDATFLSFLADQRTTDREVMTEVVKELGTVKELLQHHDSNVMGAVGEMRVRTSIQHREEKGN